MKKRGTALIRAGKEPEFNFFIIAGHVIMTYFISKY